MVISTVGEWQIPVCVSYDDQGTQKSTCAMLIERNQTIKLDATSCPGRLQPNADGAGYYRFSLDEDWWDGLIADSPNLSPAEALVLADSLGAAFHAGKMPARTYLSGLAALLNHETWDVVTAAMTQLEKLSEVVEADQLEILEQGFRDLVQPRFTQLSGKSDTGSELLQQRMHRFLAIAAKDPAMRQALAPQAASRIGLNGEPDPGAVPMNELETTLSIGAQDLGEPFFDLLLEQALASEDPAFRRAAVGALARVEDPALVVKLQAVLLSGSFTGIETATIVSRQMARVTTTEQTFVWVKENDEALIEMVPEAFRSGFIPSIGRHFCSTQRADEWESFILAHADTLPGYERSLAQAIESIQLCAAIKQAKADELVAAFREM